MKALILAGGFGTRLKDVVKDVPKPMAPILGKPFLEYQIRHLRENGINDIVLAVHHMSNKIKSYFGSGLRLGVNITYSDEEMPLGTGGAIKKAERHLDDTFLVLNGDSYAKISIEDFLNFHKSKRSNFSVSLTKSNDSSNYGSVILNGNKIIGFIEKGVEGQGLINTGVYLFEPKLFDFIEKDKLVSLEKEVFLELIKQNSLFGYVYDGYFMDIGRPETYKQFKKDAIENITLSGKEKLTYAMQKMESTGINLILVAEDNFLKGVLTDNVIKKYILKGKSLDVVVNEAMVTDPITAKAIDSSDTVSQILLSGINQLPILDDSGRIVDVEFRAEKIKSEIFPVLMGKAPLRISFAGGGTDLPYFFEKYGGVVISATIDKYCHATLVKRADSKIIVNSDVDRENIFDLNNIKCDGLCDLVKAVVNIVKPDFGFELYLRNDVPPGRGLGSSATFAVLLAKLLTNMKGLEYDDYKIAEIAYRAEREELKIKGGWQDQYAAIVGGFNYMEFSSGNNVIYPLRLKEDIINELNERMLLAYVGKTHQSSVIHANQEKSFEKNEQVLLANLNDLKKIAVEIKNCLLTNDLERIGTLLHQSWENKRKLDGSISDGIIDNLYNVGLKNGAYGGKLLGAGGGGYILFAYSLNMRNNLEYALKSEGAQIMDFNFEFKGTQVWQVKDKY